MWAVFFWLVGLVFLFFCFLFRGGVYARSSLLHRLVSSCGELGGGGGLLYLRCVGFLIAVASVVSEHGLSSGHTWAWLLLGLGDLPRPGIERMSPALAGG